MRMGIEDAFLHDILAHPDDDAPRLIYADWLDEHNDPRGEFIRIQCALAQLSDEDPTRWPLELREQELLREYEAKWHPQDTVFYSYLFRRGFIEGVVARPDMFLRWADRLFDQAPIRHLDLRERSEFVRARMREAADPLLLSQVALSPRLIRLRGLSLYTFTWNDYHLEFLSSPNLRNLTELHLNGLVVEENTDWRFTSTSFFPHLQHLDLSQNTFRPGMVGFLAELPFLHELTTLNLAHTALTLDDLRSLSNSSTLTSVRELNLSGNALTHGAMRVLAEGRLLAQLDTLRLDSNHLGDAGAFAMRDWPALPRLRRLSLGHNQIFAAGVEALAEAPVLRELISLDLSRNICCDDGATNLAGSNWTRLQALNLWFNGVGDRGLQALAHSESLSPLTWLNLTANRITRAGVRALIASRALPRLARLDLQRNAIRSEEQQRLRERFGPFVHC